MSSTFIESRFQEPLTDREVEMVRRLFSDPFSIPFEFKAWLIAYLEANPPLLPSGTIIGLHGAISSGVSGATSEVPVGMLGLYLGTTDPNPNWIIANGRLLSRTTYPEAFALWGFSCSPVPGTDPGGGNFYAPDLRDRLPAGVGSLAAVSAVGKNEGLAAGARNPVSHVHDLSNHTHGMAHTHDMSHGHSASASVGSSLIGPVAGGGADFAVQYGSISVGVSVNGITASTGGASTGSTGVPSVNATGNAQTSFLAVNFVVYVGKLS